MDDGRPKNLQPALNFAKSEKLIDNDVTSIIEDRIGKFWFDTRGHGFVYDGKTFTKVTNNGKPFTNVRSIIEDKKGNIWLAAMMAFGAMTAVQLPILEIRMPVVQMRLPIFTKSLSGISTKIKKAIF